MKSICVFCGSNSGRSPNYRLAAEEFGALLAREGIDLVYGGASNGLMGAVADAVLANGGDVIGIIPQSLVDREVAHTGLTNLHVVHSMHERKALMAELADGFVAMPGGVGTLEELFEVWTWGQLGNHAKPCALLNVDGFYDGLTQFLDHQVQEAFVRPAHRNMLIVEREPEVLLAALRAYVPPRVSKWIKPDET